MDPALRIGLDRGRRLGHDVAGGAGELRAVGLDGERDGRLAAAGDLRLGLRDPVVEGVGLGQARAVLLDATPPDVLVRVELQGAAPGVDGGLEVAGPPPGRLVAHPVGDPQPEQGVLVRGVERQGPGIGVDRVRRPRSRRPRWSGRRRPPARRGRVGLASA